MDFKRIEKIVARYRQSSLWIIVGLTLVLLLAMSVIQSLRMETVWALIISVMFSFAASMVYCSVWKNIAKISFSSLTKFYLAAPFLRMLAAAAVILVYSVVVHDRPVVVTFVLIFCAYYVALLIFDCVYFAKEEKRN